MVKCCFTTARAVQSNITTLLDWVANRPLKYGVAAKCRPATIRRQDAAGSATLVMQMQ